MDKIRHSICPVKLLGNQIRLIHALLIFKAILKGKDTPKSTVCNVMSTCFNVQKVNA